MKGIEAATAGVLAGGANKCKALRGIPNRMRDKPLWSRRLWIRQCTEHWRRSVEQSLSSLARTSRGHTKDTGGRVAENDQQRLG